MTRRTNQPPMPASPGTNLHLADEAVAFIHTGDIPSNRGAYRGRNIMRNRAGVIEIGPPLAEIDPVLTADGKRDWHPRAFSAYVKLLKHSGSVFLHMLGNGRADLPPAGYTVEQLAHYHGSYYRERIRKAQMLGWFHVDQINSCPIGQVKRGFIAKGHVLAKHILDEEPCPDGTDVELECPHFAAERAARIARHNGEMAKIPERVDHLAEQAKQTKNIERLVEAQLAIVASMAEKKSKKP